MTLVFRKFFLPLCFVLFSFHLFSQESEEFPVLSKGRFRPAEAYARIRLYDHYHASTIKKNDFLAFKTTSSSPLNFLWSLNFLGFSSYEHTPLFWIGSATLKNLLGLNLKQDRFSYHDLLKEGKLPNLQDLEKHELVRNKKIFEDLSNLIFALKEFEQFQGTLPLSEEKFQSRFKELRERSYTSKQMGQILEHEYPLAQRLKSAGTLFKALPYKHHEGDWLPLNALKVKVYQPSKLTLEEVGNFTSFSDADFQDIRNAYLGLEKAYLSSNLKDILKAQKKLGMILFQAYSSLAGNVVKSAHGKQLTYPSITQLKIELLYVHYPWIPLLLLLYGIAAALLLISYQKKVTLLQRAALGFFFLAMICHTILILTRSFILSRPPVSNMFETVIYVPWIAVCASLLFPAFRKNHLALMAACVTSIVLLVILQVTELNQSLDQVQAVLDSQFWLLVHVLLVVGSYGIFILGAMLGHFYLILNLMPRTTQNQETMKQLSHMILQTMYGGTALLISGTILGGIWAAESWGRFWDWDPKESWAFISCCFYLIWIHAYHFHRIAAFGLAFGAVSGLLAISFTWYGVNYILGSGLHSYGFGSGGEYYYYAFLGLEGLFLTSVLFLSNIRQERCAE